MYRRKIISSGVGFVVVFLCSCSKRVANGSEFLGKWQAVKPSNQLSQIEFHRNGDAYYLTAPGSDDRLPAVYNKETRVMQVDMSLMKVDFVYFQDKNTIQAMGDEWKR